jgi:hypothetical protein
MGLGGFFKGLAKVAAPVAASMIPGVGAFAGPAVAGMMKNIGKPKQPQQQAQPGRGMGMSQGGFQQRFPSMMGNASGSSQGQMGMMGGRAASPQMNMDDWISAGRNTVNPNWMLPAFNPNQPHPMSRMPPYGNAPMRPQGDMGMGGGVMPGQANTQQRGNPLQRMFGGIRNQVQPQRMQM